MQLGKTFSLKLPLRQGMRCSNQEAHRSLIFRLNLHIRKDMSAAAQSGGASASDQEPNGAGAARVVVRAGDADLSIAHPCNANPAERKAGVVSAFALPAARASDKKMNK